MKIFRLFIDENIKTWKKLSTKLLIIAVLLSLVGVLGLTKLMQHMDERNKMSVYVTENNDEYLKSEIDYLKEQLKDENLDEESKKSMQAQMEQYEMYLQYDIQLYGDTWKNDIVKSIVKLRMNGKNDEAEKLVQILKNNANILYAKYIKKDDIETLPIFYIGGSQTLPPPLSPAEEEDAIKKLANGDLETRQLLVERNLRLVVYIAKKFENTGTRNRGFNFNWNNWINEGNKHV